MNGFFIGFCWDLGFGFFSETPSHQKVRFTPFILAHANLATLSCSSPLFSDLLRWSSAPWPWLLLLLLPLSYQIPSPPLCLNSAPNPPSGQSNSPTGDVARRGRGAGGGGRRIGPSPGGRTEKLKNIIGKGICEPTQKWDHPVLCDWTEPLECPYKERPKKVCANLSQHSSKNLWPNVDKAQQMLDPTNVTPQRCPTNPVPATTPECPPAICPAAFCSAALAL